VPVLRNSTERSKVEMHGFAKVGANPVVVLAELKKTLSSGVELPKVSPFGDGRFYFTFPLFSPVLARVWTSGSGHWM
jgi:hypothetical protein